MLAYNLFYANVIYPIGLFTVIAPQNGVPGYPAPHRETDENKRRLLQEYLNLEEHHYEFVIRGKFYELAPSDALLLYRQHDSDASGNPNDHALIPYSKANVEAVKLDREVDPLANLATDMAIREYADDVSANHPWFRRSDWRSQQLAILSVALWELPASLPGSEKLRNESRRGSQFCIWMFEAEQLYDCSAFLCLDVLGTRVHRWRWIVFTIRGKASGSPLAGSRRKTIEKMMQALHKMRCELEGPHDHHRTVRETLCR